MISSVASHILAMPAWMALLVVFALPALESSAFVGFIFPGEIALILGGVVAFQGRLALAAVLAAGIAGAIVGDSVGYVVGRRYGRGLLEGTLGRFISHKHFDRAETYLSERGGKAVFFGRFTAALRVMIPGLAGMSRMHYPKFAAYNVAGGVVWASLCVILGYLGGRSWQRVAHLASRAGLAALVVVLLLLAAGVLLRRTRGAWTARQVVRVRGSAPVRWFTDRYPAPARWAAARLDPHVATGLFFTAVVVTAVAATWTFLGVTQDVRAHEELALLDPRLHAWVLAHRVGWLSALLRAATWLGSNAVLIPVLVLTAGWVSRRRRSWAPALNIAGLYVAALLAHALVQELLERARPPRTDWLVSVSGSSYPSGHTVQAAVGWGVLGLMLLEGRARRLQVRWGAAVVAVALLVATTRVYLGVSWLTDVLGALALAVGLLSVYVLGRVALTDLSGSGRGGP